MQQISSAITISRREQFSPAGMQAGEHGLAISGDSAAAQWLAERKPAEVDRLFRSQASRLGIDLKCSCEHRYPSGPNGENLPSYTVNHTATAFCAAGAASGFMPTAERFMTPAPDQTLEAWLAELSVITASRPDDAMTQEVRLRAYRTRLAAYPADVAREALFGRTWRFFPTWDELHACCETGVAERRSMLVALVSPRQKAAPVIPTEEQRANILKIQEEFKAKMAASREAERLEEAKNNPPGPDPFERANARFDVRRAQAETMTQGDADHENAA